MRPMLRKSRMSLMNISRLSQRSLSPQIMVSGEQVLYPGNVMSVFRVAKIEYYPISLMTQKDKSIRLTAEFSFPPPYSLLRPPNVAYGWGKRSGQSRDVGVDAHHLYSARPCSDDRSPAVLSDSMNPSFRILSDSVFPMIYV